LRSKECGGVIDANKSWVAMLSGAVREGQVEFTMVASAKWERKFVKS
jgi:hypothetical protein